MFPYASPYREGRGFQAGVIRDDGSPFIAGSFLDYRFALKYATEYALDLSGIPHVRANRPLKLRELRAFSSAELDARARFLRSGWADKLSRHVRSSQQAMIVRVLRERTRTPHYTALRGAYEPEAAQ